jgi:SpoIID/LytB domain protein
MGFRAKWVLLALLAFVAGPPARCLGQLPKVRIGLLQDRASVSFSGQSGVTVQSLRGERVTTWAPPEAVWTLYPEGRGVRVADAQGVEVTTLAGGARLLPPEGEMVTVHDVGGHWDGVLHRDYRGLLEVRPRGGGLTAVNLVEIETYLRGVVSSEMPATYPVEALKAQAVAARGQAIIKAGRHRRAGFDLCRTEHCQVYGGATNEAPNSDRAAAATWGEVLEYDRRIADTLYSSNCGGHTVNNDDYWPEYRPVEYLRATPDYDMAQVRLIFPLPPDELKAYLKYAPAVHCHQPWYAKTSKFRWWSIVPREELEASLAEHVGEVGQLLEVRVTDRADSGIVREIAVIGTDALYRIREGGRIRRALRGLNSASFAVEAIGEGENPPVAFAIWGAGWGHQVGMCQVGAAGLADQGWEYGAILSKYYTGCKVVRRY